MYTKKPETVFHLAETQSLRQVQLRTFTQSFGMGMQKHRGELGLVLCSRGRISEQHYFAVLGMFFTYII
jgi:hypothetical protein